MQEVGGYILGPTIGYGSSGKVKIGENIKSKEKVAIKEIPKGNNTNKTLTLAVRREVEILKLLHHPNIIKLHEIAEGESCLYLIMERTVNGELYEYIRNSGPLPETEARCFFQQMVSAIEYLHKNGVIHRDLKTENILLGENFDIKIADFGLASFIRDGEFLNSYVGSLLYSAPEVLEGRSYGPEIDVWSLGVNLYVMLCGRMPFYSDDKIDVLLSIIKESISRGAQEVIKGMLTVDPLDRMTLDEIFENTWFNENYPENLSKYRPSRENGKSIRDCGEEDSLLEEISQKMEYDLPTMKRIYEERMEEKNDFVPRAMKILGRRKYSEQLAELESFEILRWSTGIEVKTSIEVLYNDFYNSLRQLDIKWMNNSPGVLTCKKKYSIPHKEFSYDKSLFVGHLNYHAGKLMNSKHEKHSENRRVASTTFRTRLYKDQPSESIVVDALFIKGSVLLFLRTCRDLQQTLERESGSQNLMFEIDDE